jgi:hypothetical protein
MRLYEEYMQRHGMKDLPVVHHSQFTILYVERPLFYKLGNITNTTMDLIWNRTGVQSGFLETQWSRSDHRPGKYIVSFNYFPQDSCNNHTLKVRHYNICEVRWDQYESFMFSLSSQVDVGQVFANTKKLQLRAWEMFVAACDSYFSSQGGDVKYLLFQSLDQENSEDSRMGYQREVVKKIAGVSPQLARCWNDEIYQRLQNQSAWFVDLIGKKCKKNTHLLG